MAFRTVFFTEMFLFYKSYHGPFFRFWALNGVNFPSWFKLKVAFGSSNFMGKTTSRCLCKSRCPGTFCAHVAGDGSAVTASSGHGVSTKVGRSTRWLGATWLEFIDREWYIGWLKGWCPLQKYIVHKRCLFYRLLYVVNKKFGRGFYKRMIDWWRW